jgi:hypothetical protein
MKTALELPLYRPDRNFKRHPIDVATALRLEQDTLMQEDCQRAGLPLISLDQDFREFEREGLTFKLLQADSRPDDRP